MKLYLIAGEKSGDLHASNLAKALKQKKDVQLRGIGGEKSQNEGLHLFIHYKELALMGFWEVITKLSKIKKILRATKKDIKKFNPDAIILIDFAGFNLRIAKFAKQNNIPVLYYISPKIWAWNEKRVNKIKKWVDKMFVILPFEKEFYQKHNYQADYVGNPLFDEIKFFQPNHNFRKDNSLSSKEIIAILPGSRKQEISRVLPELVKIKDKFTEYQIVVAGISQMDKSIYTSALENDVKIVYDQTYDLLNNSTVAIVTSGTATLETALFNIPQVVCYKTSKLSYAIAKMLIKVKYISLVNLIAQNEIVPELIQAQCNPNQIQKTLARVIDRKEQIKLDYQEMRKQIETEESTSDKVAELVISHLRGKAKM